MAERLKARLADLLAAGCLNDLVAGRPEASREGRQVSVDLCDGMKLVFCVNHDVLPLTRGGAVDWSNVSRVKILRIGKQNV